MLCSAFRKSKNTGSETSTPKTNPNGLAKADLYDVMVFGENFFSKKRNLRNAKRETAVMD